MENSELQEMSQTLFAGLMGFAKEGQVLDSNTKLIFWSIQEFRLGKNADHSVLPY